MKKIDEIKLEAKVSDLICKAFDPYCPSLNYSELNDISEGLAMNIVAEVRGAA